MNPVLAQLYGTGFDKTASEYIDPSQISGAEMLALMEAEEMNKVAYDDGVDLSHLSGRQLLELYAEAEEAEAYDNQGYALEKMAQDGSLEYWDMVGRIQAHAYADEMNKLASYGDDYDYIDLDEVDGETMMALLEDGWEIEKTAGPRWDAAKGFASKMWKGFKDTSPRDITSAVGRRAGAARDAVMTATPGSIGTGVATRATRLKNIATAKELRTAASMEGVGAPTYIYQALRGQHGDMAKSEARKFVAFHGGMAGATAALGAGTAAAGATGVAGLAAAGGGAYYMKKKKKGPWAKGGRFNR